MKAGAGWPIGIATVLLAGVVVNVAVMRIASNDPSFAVEPDYYSKAVSYDSTLAVARASAVLGWHADATIRADGTAARLQLLLTDSTGAAVQDAAVRVLALRVARASVVDSLVLVADSLGGYTAPLPAYHAGRWELRLDARRGVERFTETIRIDVPMLAVGTRSEPAP